MAENPYIVVVDDDTMDRELIRQAVKSAGINAVVEEHENGASVIEEALSRYTISPPSVIYLTLICHW